VLRRLSVFAGGWSLDAAQAVCGDPSGGEVLDTLARLADKSLVTVDESREAAEARYRLLETIRQYARDKLLASGESERIRDRHLEHYLGFAEEAEPHLRTADQLAWLERLETEHDNLRGALAWSLESADAERALRLAGAAAYFWELRGRYWSEGHRWLDAALALSSHRQGPGVVETQAAPRAKALYAVGRLLFAARGEPSGSREIVEASLRSWRELGDKWWIAVALEHVGFMLIWEGDLQTARARLDEGVTLARQVEDQWPLALCLIRLSGALGPTDMAGAHRAREEGVVIARSVGDKSMLSQGLEGLAFLYALEGNLAAAGPLAAEALSEARAIGAVTQIFLSLLVLAIIASLQGDQAAARGRCLELFALARQSGSTNVQLVGLLASGVVACSGPDPALGVRLLTAIDRFGAERGVTTGGVGGIFAVLVGPAMEIARGRLDPVTFEAALEEGRTLTLEQAVELAIAG
jgi:predicted ATPase